MHFKLTQQCLSSGSAESQHCSHMRITWKLNAAIFIRQYVTSEPILDCLSSISVLLSKCKPSLILTMQDYEIVFAIEGVHPKKAK